MSKTTLMKLGTAKSATDARKQINAKPGDAHISDADKKLRALQDAFARAPIAARRAFVTDNADELHDLLDALNDEVTPARREPALYESGDIRMSRVEPSKTWWSADELANSKLPTLPGTRQGINLLAAAWRLQKGCNNLPIHNDTARASS